MLLQRFRLGPLDLVVLAVTLVVLLAVLYPIFTGADTRPTGLVVDGNGRPIPGATLRFRDETGRVVETITADRRGIFRRRGLRSLSQYDVDGFALTRYRHSTGGSSGFYFTPVGRHKARFRDAAGKAVADLPVSLVPDMRTWNTAVSRKAMAREMFERHTSEDGTVVIESVPVGARLDLRSRDRRYVVRTCVITPLALQNGREGRSISRPISSSERGQGEK